MTRNRFVSSLLAGILAALPGLSCFSDRSVLAPGGDGCEVPGSAIGPDQAVVFIRNFAFHPDTLRIEPGTRVTWVNCEPATVEPHTSTSSDDDWDSGLIAPGESFAHTFTQAGTNDYFCQPHTFMEGAIIVQ